MVLGSINGINGATSDVNIGIGTASPAQKLEVNGSIRQAIYSSITITILPNSALQYPWQHNLGYQPVIMISLDQTGGGGCDYVNFSYGHLDNNNLVIYLTNRNASGTATGKVKWIVVY